MDLVDRGGPEQNQWGVSLPGTQDFGMELARNICQPIQRQSMLFSANSKGRVFLWYRSEEITYQKIFLLTTSQSKNC